MRRELERRGVSAMLVDMSIGLGESTGADISRETVFSNIGVAWDDVRSKTKGALMELMTEAIKATILLLYGQNKIDGVMSAGGVQNTSVSTAAMQLLPIGFPKLVATTVACGQRSFGSVVGLRDIVVIPSISDFTGMNIMTTTILRNACACMAGMVQTAGTPLRKADRPVVGVTLMGITNDGCCAAIDELARNGVEAIGFHSTGVGGSIMEQLALDGTLDGILDITTHEITSEFFGGGFSYGAQNRLIKPLQAGVPMVVSVGGLDFVDFGKWEFPPRMDERVYNMHNGQLAHIKVLPDEAKQIGSIFASRLNQVRDSVRLVLPTEGMRKNTRPGENLYAPDTDEALLQSILSQVNTKVHIQTLPGNINDVSWGRAIAQVMLDTLRERGIHFSSEDTQ